MVTTVSIAQIGALVGASGLSTLAWTIVRLRPNHQGSSGGHTRGMSPLHRPCGRTLATPSCTFKLYGEPLAFEAASWTRHVVRGRPPSIPAYLAEFYP